MTQINLNNHYHVAAVKVISGHTRYEVRRSIAPFQTMTDPFATGKEAWNNFEYHHSTGSFADYEEAYPLI
jgi:hypothetical protein